MTIRISSLETHHALRAHALTHLPVRTIVGHWARELGIRNGTAVFPGPRRNPGNVTSQHAGRVCGYLEGGDAHERHKFPVYCTTSEGVKEYAWYFNNLSYYNRIARQAGGNWRRACDLIERSPWSSSHYGGTLDATAGQCRIAVIRTTSRAAARRSAARDGVAVATLPAGILLARSGVVIGDLVAGSRTWYRARYGAGDGRIVYIHSSLADAAIV